MKTVNKNKTHIVWYVILILALIAAVWWGTWLYFKNKNMELRLDNQYNRAFHELVDYVDDIQTSLNKGMLVNSPAQMASISSDLFRKSAAAKASLGQLPISDIEIDKTAKFLTQVGDYTYMLSQNMINNQKLSEEDYKNLESLSSYAASLNQSLLNMQDSVYDGTIKFTNKPAKQKNQGNNTAEAAGTDALSMMENVEKEFQEYPSLIYDGPFSEHMESMKPVMLENASEITQEEAMLRAKEFLGERGNNLTFEGETQNTNIDAYTFSGNTNDRQISISVTKKGGYIVYFLDNRAVELDTIDFTKAIEYAQEFLTTKGYTSLKTSYYDKSNGIATVNFAYEQKDTTCYSDLIKVRVALDNGEILGIESHGYIMNHKERTIPAPKLSEAEARKKINPHLNIDSVNMAVIPKDSMREVYCYEFHGKFNDKNFIIYINADNGNEEKILMLLESEDGILTI